MTTLVGTQDKLIDAVKSLIELDYDAIEAYQMAIEAYQMAIDNLENQQHKNQLENFVTILENMLINYPYY